MESHGVKGGSNGQDFKAIDREIVAKTDVVAFYRDTLNFTIRGAGENENHWLSVLGKDAAGKDEKKPSAAINVGSGTARGRYRNLANGDSFSIFEAGARFGRFSDFRATRAYLAEKAGVALPKAGGGKKTEKPEDKLSFLDKSPRQAETVQLPLLRKFVTAKPPTSVDAVKMCGGRAAFYPANMPQGLAPQEVIAFPVFAPNGFPTPEKPQGKPCGYDLGRADGQPVSVYQGKGEDRADAKYYTLPGGKPGWVGAWGLLHMPGAEVVWLPEGLPDLCSLQDAIPKALREKHVVITNSGGATQKLPKEMGDCLADKVVYVPGDCDNAGSEGVRRRVRLARLGGAKEVRVVVLPFPAGSKKDVRDFLAVKGNTYDHLLALAQAASPEPHASGGGSSGGDAPPPGAGGNFATISIPEIDADGNAALVAEDAAKALALRLPGSTVEHVYEMNNALYTVIDDGTGRLWAVPLPRSRVVEFLAARATFWKGANEVRAPDWLRDAVFDRRHFEGLPPLSAVVRCPVMRADGSLLVEPGYDLGTKLLLDWKGEPLAVPDRPTKADVVRARGELLEPVQQFPFEKSIHKAALMAAVLTPLARPAFPGPSPMFLCDANVRGSGKTKLFGYPVAVATGRNIDPTRYTTNDEELDKRLLACSGKPYVFFDNVRNSFGGGLLDMVLTAPDGRYESRVLGLNRMAVVNMSATTWFATGNNLTIVGDTARRVCYVRLRSEEERPEERDGFTHPDLLAYVMAERPRLLRAALTILRAFHLAGRPDGGLKPWGSFEGWSALVRAAVVFCGLDDPYETCKEVGEEADVEKSAVAALLPLWQKMDEKGKGLTTAHVIARLYDDPADEDYFDDMRAAIDALGCRKSSYKLGYALRAYRDRFIDGRCFAHAGEQHNTTRWVVKGKTPPKQRDLPLE
jgi:hypothetical protein